MHENPKQLEPISSSDEELQIPVSSVPVMVVPPSPSATGLSVEALADAMLPTPSPTDPEPMVLVHIPTVQLSVDSHWALAPTLSPISLLLNGHLL